MCLGCLLAVLGSQDIVVKCTVAIFIGMVVCTRITVPYWAILIKANQKGLFSTETQRVDGSKIPRYH